MCIIIDDQYRHHPRCEEFFDSFCKRLEKRFNDIHVFEAAMQFYKAYHFIKYSSDHNSVVCGYSVYDAGPCKTLIYVLKEITEV